MWDWIEKPLELINLYGFPIVMACVLLIAAIAAVRALWDEFRALQRRHDDLLSETSRLVELAAYESEIAREAIDLTLRRLGEIHRTVNELCDALSEKENNSETN